MTSSRPAAPRRIANRYDGARCRRCGVSLGKGIEVSWTPGVKGVTCASGCVGPELPGPELAGSLSGIGGARVVESLLRGVGTAEQVFAVTLDPGPVAAATPATGDRVKLHADMLPSTVWGSNVRAVLGRAQWDALRIPLVDAVKNLCQICGEPSAPQGRRRRCDLHELWTWWRFADSTFVQSLSGLVVLCDRCHAVQHSGFARMRGEEEGVLSQLQAVNGWTRQQALYDLARAWTDYEVKERVRWDLDLSCLRLLLTVADFPELYVPWEARGRLGTTFVS